MDAPIFSPSSADFQRSRLWGWMQQRGFTEVAAFHRWSCTHREDFWKEAIARLGLRFSSPPRTYLEWDEARAVTTHLVGARLNIAESCFLAPPDKLALVDQREDGRLRTWTYGELRTAALRVASALGPRLDLRAGDAVAIQMPLTGDAVVIYLGLVLAGCRVVSIADSFAPAEVSTRLRIAEAKAIFTQDFMLRGGKAIPLYEKVAQAQADFPVRAVVVAVNGQSAQVPLRPHDVAWTDFLGAAQSGFNAVIGDPGDVVNILFSSGTTGDPKAIGWTHTTPIKCAVDAMLHHDIQADDVVSWPTNLGWMMGPWLLFAGFLNRATVVLFDGAPHSAAFGRCVEKHGVTVLGVVPSLVKAWRTGGTLHGVDLTKLRSFSSTGECSNPDDMQWLAAQAGGKPVIEYCGGTEIGGGYLSSTRIQDNFASTFSTVSFGLDLVILDGDLRESSFGEVFLIPPSIGLSDRLLNRDHHETYFAGTPPGPGGQRLRRHGDEAERLPGGYFRAHGRSDDTMNLGGIKVSSAEIERTVNRVPGIKDSAAIAVNPPGGGPSQLVLALVLEDGGPTRDEAVAHAQNAIRGELNPLFKIADAWTLAALPRTASNKVLRRVLRADYLKTVS